MSQLNAKIEAAGGSLDGDGAGIGAISIAAPMFERYGIQFDAAGGSADGDGLAGYGLHAFWRDPQQGLLDVVSSRAGRSGEFVNRYGIEGEYYAGQWTLAATVGSQTGFLGSTGYGDLDASYYINDNLQINAGVNGFSDEHQGRVGIEWQPGLNSLSGLTVFADGGAGDNDYILAGVRVYFGTGDKTLKRRHREDDPVNVIRGQFTNMSGAIADQRQIRAVARQVVDSGSSAPSGPTGGAN